jgi:hypothetical protein
LYKYEDCNKQKHELETLQQSPNQLLGPCSSGIRFHIKNEDSFCHEGKYDPTHKGSESYKKYMMPFSHGMPEQWLKFMENINVVICGNGLDKNVHASFNLTRSSLDQQWNILKVLRI